MASNNEEIQRESKKPKLSSQPNENLFEVLPLGILSDILVQLTSKDLVCCACSCKYLYQFIIINPYFTAALHKHNCLRDPLIFFRYFLEREFKQYYSLKKDDGNSFDVGQDELELPFHYRFYRRCFNVVGTYNGVICLSDDLYAYNDVITLWNPSIRKALQLPVPSITVETHGPMDIVVGFGVDFRLCDYKVVRLAYIGRSSCIGSRAPPKVEVYSVRNCSWKTITTPGPLYDIRSQMSSPVYTQCFVWGSCHWPAWKDDAWSAIVAFNLTTEAFGGYKLPGALQGAKCCDVNLKVLEIPRKTKPILGVIQIENFKYVEDKRVAANVLSIWAMTQAGVVESWALVFRFNFRDDNSRPRLCAFLRNLGLITVLGYSEQKHALYRTSKNKMTLEGEVKATPFGFFLSWYVESMGLFREGRAVPVTILEKPVVRGDGEEDDNLYDEVTELKDEEEQEEEEEEDGEYVDSSDEDYDYGGEDMEQGQNEVVNEGVQNEGIHADQQQNEEVNVDVQNEEVNADQQQNKVDADVQNEEAATDQQENEEVGSEVQNEEATTAQQEVGSEVQRAEVIAHDQNEEGAKADNEEVANADG